MKKFGDVIHGRAILIEKEDLESGCLECKLRGLRADYFIVPAEIKQDNDAMKQLQTCTIFTTQSDTIQFAEILFYE